jgi:hypothetical protein
MIKPWLFEFLPELGGPSLERDSHDVAKLFTRYFDLWVRKRVTGAKPEVLSSGYVEFQHSPWGSV